MISRFMSISLSSCNIDGAIINSEYIRNNYNSSGYINLQPIRRMLLKFGEFNTRSIPYLSSGIMITIDNKTEGDYNNGLRVLSISARMNDDGSIYISSNIHGIATVSNASPDYVEFDIVTNRWRLAYVDGKKDYQLSLSYDSGNGRPNYSGPLSDILLKSLCIKFSKEIPYEDFPFPNMSLYIPSDQEFSILE